MRYLITGHTGFKGSWLALWLAKQGHEVAGIALDPMPGSLFDMADIGSLLIEDIRQDIRDAGALQSMVSRIRPDVVFHLAAQPLVRASYVNPRETVETNVMGTLNVLEAVKRCPTVQAHLVITTDKVYRNVGQEAGYLESDALGGDDPYSASKAMADILTNSWVHSFDGPPTAVARAGNVIGGGDVSPDRLLPDVVKAFTLGRSVELRYPQAIRPWQHVLDCLDGYVRLSQHLLTGVGTEGGSWNFGPGRQGFRTVADVVDTAARSWGAEAAWISNDDEHPYEAAILALDSTKAESKLSWRNHLNFDQAITWVVEWYKEVGAGKAPREVSEKQLSDYWALNN